MFDKLEELAKATDELSKEFGNAVWFLADDIVEIATDEVGMKFIQPADAAYIAACDPSTILRLVRVARAAKVILAHLDEGARPDQIALDELRAALKETT
jgi:hypothetical protein